MMRPTDETGWLRAILTAPVYDIARNTPLEAAPVMTKRLGNRMWLKREDLQPVFSFKLRGAYNRLTKLDADERGRHQLASNRISRPPISITSRSERR